MFFDDLAQIPGIAEKCATAIFVVPAPMEVEVSGALVLEPEEKATITIEQVREVMARLTVRQTSERFVLIRPADKLGEEAENALLKSLEEPGERVHFVLATSELSGLLPTIRSRSEIYVLRRPFDLKAICESDTKIKDEARRLLAVKPAELVQLAEELTRKKDGVRAHVLAVFGAAIEMAYKAYLLSGKPAFLARAERMIAVYEAVERNGNTKLQIVAGMIQ